jgi:hypothetical protein
MTGVDRAQTNAHPAEEGPSATAIVLRLIEETKNVLISRERLAGD